MARFHRETKKRSNLKFVTDRHPDRQTESIVDNNRLLSRRKDQHTNRQKTFLRLHYVGRTHNRKWTMQKLKTTDELKSLILTVQAICEGTELTWKWLTITTAVLLTSRISWHVRRWSISSCIMTTAWHRVEVFNLLPWQSLLTENTTLANMNSNATVTFFIIYLYKTKFKQEIL